MILVYWCATCRALHGAGEIVFPSLPGESFLCQVTGKAVQLRGIAEDTDVANYGAKRCPTCQRPRQDEVGPCPDCGAD